MSHFAKVVDGVVQNVIVAEQDFIDTLEDKDLWIQTSYNTSMNKHWAADKLGVEEDTSKPALRGNYASIGGLYDSVNDVFTQVKPYGSWVMNTSKWDWEAPIAMPDPTDEVNAGTKFWMWFEEDYENDTGDPKTKGWRLIDVGYQE